MPSSDPRAEGEASGTKKDLFDTFVSRLFKPALNYVQQQATKTGKILKMFLEVDQNHRRFEYSTLPQESRHIRLLELLPGNKHDVLRCSLRVVSLDNCPKYTALSYSWMKDRPWTKDTFEAIFERMPLLSSLVKDLDDHNNENFRTSTGPDKTILCDGQVIRIFPNLYDALLQLRESRPAKYWIDAICIDQSNTKERTHQVRMMDQIYADAESVIVWLGTCPLSLSPFVDRLLRSPAGLHEDFANLNSSRMIEHICGYSLASLYLLLRSWFTRVWVIQEVCFAKDLIFLLGRYEIQPRDLVEIVSFNHYIHGSNLLFSKGSKFLQGEESPVDNSEYVDLYQPLSYAAALWGDHIKRIPELLQSRQEFQNGAKWHLAQWFEMCRGKFATRHHDAVFAGMGLVNIDSLRINPDIQADQGASPPLFSSHNTITAAYGNPIQPTGLTNQRLWPVLRIDYEVGFLEILVNLAACLLSNPNGTYILSLASLFRNPDPDGYESRDAPSRPMVHLTNSDRGEKVIPPEEIPSWMPNPASRNTKILSTFDTQKGSNFAACSQLQNIPKISFDGTTLFLEGARFDTIHIIGGSLSPIDTLEGFDFAIEIGANPRDLVAFAERLAPKYQSAHNSSLYALASVLVGGVWQGEAPPSADLIVAFCYWFDTCAKKMLNYYKNHDNDSKASEIKGACQSLRDKYHPWPGDAEIGSQGARLELIQRFSRAHRHTMTWRKAFVTAGGYLGIGPRSLMEGDVVMLIKGGYVPYIFRRPDNEIKCRLAKSQRGLFANQTLTTNQISELEHKVEGLKAWEEVEWADDVYVLVGEAYVEGIMYGEAVSEYQGKFRTLSII